MMTPVDSWISVPISGSIGHQRISLRVNATLVLAPVKLKIALHTRLLTASNLLQSRRFHLLFYGDGLPPIQLSPPTKRHPWSTGDMLTLVPLIYIIRHVRAQNSTSDALEGWQFDDNSRSSWDILWTCVSTIFACTWASLHLSLDFTRRARIRRKLAGWFISLFATEFIVIIAAIHFVTARDVATRCNAAFGVPKVEAKSEEGLPVPAHARAIVEKLITEKNSGPWTMVHGFCVDMCGFSLRTQDGWAYPIHSKNVVPLIEAGLIQPGDLDEAEIKDHAKSDGVAKLLAVVQSLWVVVNVLARAAYHLPISPLELSTVAYVFCAVIAYALWWHKPQDMKTPITLHIPYNKTGENVFPGLDELLIAKPHLWRHQTLQVSKKEDPGVAKSVTATTAPTKPTAPTAPTPAKRSAIERPRHHVWSDGLVSKLSPQTEILFTLYAAIIFQGFCAIHVAAYVPPFLPSTATIYPS